MQRQAPIDNLAQDMLTMVEKRTQLINAKIEQYRDLNTMLAHAETDKIDELVTTLSKFVEEEKTNIIIRSCQASNDLADTITQFIHNVKDQFPTELIEKLNDAAATSRKHAISLTTELEYLETSITELKNNAHLLLNDVAELEKRLCQIDVNDLEAMEVFKKDATALHCNIEMSLTNFDLSGRCLELLIKYEDMCKTKNTSKHIEQAEKPITQISSSTATLFTHLTETVTPLLPPTHSSSPRLG